MFILYLHGQHVRKDLSIKVRLLGLQLVKQLGKYAGHEKSANENMDWSQRHCLRAKDEDSDSVNLLAAWSLVCHPKKHCDAGITLRVPNIGIPPLAQQGPMRIIANQRWKDRRRWIFDGQDSETSNKEMID
jgi:hypothetical protein